jgi:hypothetical protein
VGLTAYLLFFLAGLGFRYAALGRWEWLPLLFPLLLGIGAIAEDGPDVAILARLLVALAIAAGGVVLGRLIETRTGSSEQPGYA